MTVKTAMGRRPVLIVATALCIAALAPAPLRPAGGIAFRGPLTISNVPRPPVTVHAGDLNGDRKADLVVSNGTGTVTVFFQDPADRTAWSSVPIRVGASCFFSRPGDFDNDGIDDLAVADSASTAYFIKSNGDGTFGRPVSMPQARGSRWIALGDWNKDGNLDLAASNLNTSTLTIFLGDGAGAFAMTQSLSSGREHTLEAVDYDGDGILDLALGVGLPGIRIHKGIGDGKFAYQRNVSNLGCVEYIATGDFNGDGLGDLAPTCIDDATAYVGVSQGNGNYLRTLAAPFATGTESSAVADLNGDGKEDLALVSQGSGLLKVHLGTGDGKFQAPLDFVSTGGVPVFLIARDLDGDGRADVVSCDNSTATLTVFFGREGEKFLESADSVSGIVGSAKAFAVTDFDGDGAPDLFFASLTQPKVFTFMAPGGSSPTSPDLTVDMANKISVLAVEDLNGDSVPDLAGSSQIGDAAVVALLNAGGGIISETLIPCGDGPQDIKSGRLDGDAAPDLVLPLTRLNSLALLRNLGNGSFAEPLLIATAGSPKRLALGDADGDGQLDIVAIGTKTIAIHYGAGDGGFSEPIPLADDTLKNFTDGAVGDFDADGKPDVLVGENRTLSVLLHPGKGGREFDPPLAIKMLVPVTAVFPADVDGDGLVDLTASSGSSQAVSIAYRTAEGGFTEAEVYRVGLGVAFHRVIDMNRDGTRDILAMGSAGGSIRLGEKVGPVPEPLFRRGDADANTRVEINDPVLVLNSLFGTSGPLPCEDAADADDGGTLNVTDAVFTLNWLFFGGPAPRPPGPSTCGFDPGADTLSEACRGGC